MAEISAYFRSEFSAESDRMLVYRDEKFIVYETGTWIELLSFGIPCDCVYAFSPDFSLFTASESAPAENTPIVIWDVSTGKQLQSLEGNEGFTAFLLFSPDGKMLWRARERGDLIAWSTRDWRFLNGQQNVQPEINGRKKDARGVSFLSERCFWTGFRFLFANEKRFY